MPKKTRRASGGGGGSGSLAGLQRTAVEFNPDYSHIVRDLRRIGVLAGIFFVLLIALSFFLR